MRFRVSSVAPSKSKWFTLAIEPARVLSTNDLEIAVKSEFHKFIILLVSSRFRCRFDKCLQVGMNVATVRNDRARKRKLSTESAATADGRIEEHKTLKAIGARVVDAYEAAFGAAACRFGCTPDALVEQTVAFIERLPVDNDVSTEARQAIARQRALAFAVS